MRTVEELKERIAMIEEEQRENPMKAPFLEETIKHLTWVLDGDHHPEPKDTMGVNMQMGPGVQVIQGQNGQSLNGNAIAQQIMGMSAQQHMAQTLPALEDTFNELWDSRDDHDNGDGTMTITIAGQTNTVDRPDDKNELEEMYKAMAVIECGMGI